MRTLILILLIYFITSCVRTENVSNDKENANKMYDDLCSLVIAYNDSLNQSSDSVHIENMILDYERKLTEIVFSYPPNTDLNMTNGQQDTLSQLTDKFIELKKIKILATSNIESDSIRYSISPSPFCSISREAPVLAFTSAQYAIYGVCV